MGKQTTVRVVAVSSVVPAPMDHGGELPEVKLSFLDAPLIVRPMMQQVLLYELQSRDEFPAAVTRLKESLAVILAINLPLVGKLAYREDTGDVVVDRSDPSVAFVEACADGGNMEVRRLAGNAEYDVPTFLSLVPELDTGVLPVPVLAVQVTRLGGGAGLALGICINHAILDGRAMGMIMALWSFISREGWDLTKNVGSLGLEHSRAAIAHPLGDGLAREILKKVASNLPVVKSAYRSSVSQLARRTFYLNEHDIRMLKRRIDSLASSNGGVGQAPKPISTFLALSALGWTSFVRSKALDPADDAYLTFPVDLRERLDPPVSQGYMGNCIKVCLAAANVGDLVGEEGLLHASRAIMSAMMEADAAPLAGTEEPFTVWVKRLPQERVAWVAGSTRLGWYDVADFGFGRPIHAETVTMNDDCRMAISAGRRDGDIQISVSIDPACVEAFTAYICTGQRMAKI